MSKAADAKELARKLRREAYQAAKERRAKDPRYLAMKEEAKRQRRALYQEVKAKRKAEAKVGKRETEARRTEARETARQESYRELMKLVTVGTKGPPVLN